MARTEANLLGIKSGAKRIAIPVATTLRIIERDQCTCQVCGKVGTFDTRFQKPVVVEYTTERGRIYGGKDCTPFEIHHKKPSFLGQNNSDENLELRCRSCNRRQGLMEQLGDLNEKLLRT